MKKAAGFTLIEVLVSVVVLSTGIIFVLHAFETATVALSEMRDAIWASNVAQSEIDKMRVRGAAGSDIADGYWSGRTSTYYSDFIWERNVRSAELEGVGDADLRHVVMGVRRDGANRMYKYETYVRIARPPAKEGGQQ